MEGGAARRNWAAPVAGSAGEGGETTRDSPRFDSGAWLGSGRAGKGTPRHSRAAAARSPAPARWWLGGRRERAGELS
jgi:hypothetical protein